MTNGRPVNCFHASSKAGETDVARGMRACEQPALAMRPRGLPLPLSSLPNLFSTRDAFAPGRNTPPHRPGRAQRAGPVEVARRRSRGPDRWRSRKSVPRSRRFAESRRCKPGPQVHELSAMRPARRTAGCHRSTSVRNVCSTSAVDLPRTTAIVFAGSSMACSKRPPSQPSVPIPKFASLCCTLVCELRNQRDTSNL